MSGLSSERSFHLIDAHCHLDLFPDFRCEAERRDRAKVWTLAVTTLPQAWRENHVVAAQHELIEVALGIHPELVAKYPDAVDIWVRLAEEARFVGEVGLDGRRRNRHSLARQREVFSTVLNKCTALGGKILSVHSAGAQREVVSLIEEQLDLARNSAVLHWFTGSSSLFAKATELGCYFSVNLAMLADHSIAQRIAELPRDRLLTESDAPFLPHKAEAGPCAEETLRRLAGSLGLPVESTAQILDSNLQRLLRSR